MVTAKKGLFIFLVAIIGFGAGATVDIQSAQAYIQACETNICNFGTGDCAYAPEEEFNCQEIAGGCSQTGCEA